MLLLTSTSTPLSTTDARYIYRCLDASSKQINKLASLLEDSKRFTKTFLSRCQSLAHSAHKKLSRCTTVLGSRNPDFNTLLEEVSRLARTFTSKVTFPSRFHTRARNGSVAPMTLLNRTRLVREALLALLHVVGDMLAARSGQPTAPKENEPNPSLLEDFFAKAEKDKGWKIQRGPVPKEKDPAACGDDPFGIGCQIVSDLSLPYNMLLPDDVEVGLVSFSIILLEAYRLPQTVLRECGNMSPLHKIFGSYVVLQNVTLMGIHQDLMRVVGKGKEQIDESRFRNLIPYLSRNYPETTDVLAKTFPSGPTRYARRHYYSPLLPRQLINSHQFSLGNWSFLTNRAKAGTEHSRS